MAAVTRPEKSVKQILEQKRAQHALAMVREAEGKFREGSDARKSFVSCVESLSAAILTNGLGQAAASLLAESGKDTNHPHRMVYNSLEKWLCRDDRTAPYQKLAGCYPLMTAIVNGDRASYIKAQTEALSYLDWLKKFTVAFLKEPQRRQEGEANG